MAIQSKKHPDLSRLSTEKTNRASTGLDQMSALEMVRTMNREDAKVARAIRPALPQIARAIDWIADGIRHGGRLIYVGAGTSGRIAAQDAAEVPPTFGVAPRAVQFIMAGGSKALRGAVESVEDSRALGEREMAAKKPGENDVVIGIAASGRTPFTIAALAHARRHGAKTVAVTCNPNSPLERVSDLAIVAEVGPEVLSGSTRMKAGTSQKMILNMLSTGSMTRLGYVYGNLMVNLHLKNEKLAHRAISILQNATGAPRSAASGALKSGGSVPVALVMLEAKVGRTPAQRALKAEKGNVRQAIARVLTERRADS
jgi:N-acetylmuramic acid 6-phosphate etherase